jgi:hypothetical protein
MSGPTCFCNNLWRKNTVSLLIFFLHLQDKFFPLRNCSLGRNLFKTKRLLCKQICFYCRMCVFYRELFAQSP